MSKSLEELGYEKLENFSNFVYSDKNRDKFISFKEETKRVHCENSITMEELKAINKWCEEHNWIECISREAVINIISNKIKELRDEYDERARDNDSYYAYSNEYAHIEEVLKELIEEVSEC